MEEKFSVSRKEIWLYTDKISAVAVVLIFLCGLMSIHSASITFSRASALSAFVYKQFIWGIAGALIYVGVIRADYRNFLAHAGSMFAVMTIMFLALLVVGHSAKGAQRWLDLGFMKFQPSELGKVIFALAMAKFTSAVPPRDMRTVAASVAVAGCFIVPVMLQPDLGSSLVFAVMLIAVLIAAGIPGKILACMAGLGVLSLPLGWMILKPYQRMRILVFLNPYVDPRGAGYNVIQSRIAVGSGGFWGKGFLQGTQGRLHFLPEQHTDFIFSVFSEEFGFVGCAIVIVLFFVLIYRILDTAQKARDSEGRTLCVAVAAWLWFQITESIAMTMGLAPVTGLPLPLMSYGGSSLVVITIALGLVQSVNIAAQKDKF